MIKVFTTPELVEINRVAVQKNRNRSLTDEFIAQLDPEGAHVSIFGFLHNDEEIRTELLCKMIGEDEPVRVDIDMDIDTYNNASGYVIREEDEDVEEV